MKTINWNVTKKEIESITSITKRVHKLWPKIFDQMDLSMDITATHLNGTPLDFDKLIEFDDFNFNHDIFGITNHMDRATGKLKDCFVPRCATPGYPTTPSIQ